MKRDVVLLLIAIFVTLFSLSIVFLPWINILLSVIYSPLNEETNFLVLGLDKDIQNTRRTDVIMFLNINVKNREIKITNIPRDLIINNSKINSIYQKEGLDYLKELVENFVGKKIDKYAIVDYDVVRLVGDRIGPVEVYVDKPMKYTDYSQNLIIDFDPGIHYLYGEQLLAYMRFRKDSLGDIGRIEREKYIINQLIKAALKKDVFTLAKVFKEVYESMDTNIKTSELVFLATKFKDGFSIKSYSFPIKYDVNGNIYPGDLSKLKEFFSSKSLNNVEERYRFYIVNNTKNQNRTYNVNLHYMWKAAGYIPEDIYFMQNKNFSSDTVYVVNEEVNVEEIEKIVKTVHPKRNFKILLAKEDLENYLILIDTLTKNRNYPDLSVDFVVILSQ
ncbi:LCP family protein [Thermosipho globiformans]|uniref:LCP family protein n=1 Tax=Thermosipho globiformans TaxID=380685 RepID=UPI000F8C612E|nr:LCP family protein [Thermosipho globiformans]